MEHSPVTTNPLIIMMINMTVVFIVLVVLMYLIKLIHFVDPTKESEKPAEDFDDEEPLVAVKSADAPAPEPVAAVTPPPATDVNLQATFSDDCWTRVIVDGKLEYEGMLNAGQTGNWKGQSINVLLGNAGAVQFVKNGQNVGALGGDGDVVEHTFTLN